MLTRSVDLLLVPLQILNPLENFTSWSSMPGDLLVQISVNSDFIWGGFQAFFSFDNFWGCLLSQLLDLLDFDWLSFKSEGVLHKTTCSVLFSDCYSALLQCFLAVLCMLLSFMACDPAQVISIRLDGTNYAYWAQKPSHEQFLERLKTLKIHLYKDLRNPWTRFGRRMGVWYWKDKLMAG